MLHPTPPTSARPASLGRRVGAALAAASLALNAAATDSQMMDDGDSPAMAGQAPALTADEVKFFESRIRPILIANCYGCHSVSSGKSRGGLRLDTREAMLSGGDSGPAVVPGDLDSSLLIRAVRYLDADYEMPPAGKLRDEDIKLLEEWVAMGAPDPRVDGAMAPAAGASPGTEHRWTDEDIARARSAHWSYRTIADTPPSAVSATDWPLGTIDRHLLAAMEERGLTPAPDADRRTLLRRASLDLTGLPPSPAALEAFERDQSPAAFAGAIDALLASPAFGERWGRHWLDVARFAESSGKESNIFYPHAWRYRDYVIRSFNEDKPFDDFLVEQLAGDLLPAASDAERAEHLVATGYLAVGSKSHNLRGRPQFQMDLADEQIDAVTQGMLGLTVSCARCHDHKFDPIPQKDYYAVAGIFLSTDTRYGTFDAQGNTHPAGLIELPDAPSVHPGPTMPRAQRSLLATAHERTVAEAARGRELQEQARAARQRGDELPANLQQQIVRARVVQGAERNLGEILERYDESGEPTDANRVAMGAVDRTRALNARFLDRGEIDKPLEVVPRGFVRLVSQGDEPRITKGSGRLEFAEWVVDERNPLTARVWANRVWLKLFGKGLVPTPDNFGMSGQQPSHPELLDHLAARLIALDWSTKALIREIMLSRAYAMSSAFDAKDAETDPDNTYLWRMPKKRLEAEAIRDSMLLAAGLLDQTPREGSPVAFLEGATRGQQQARMLESIAGTADNRRSVYLPIVRDRVPESLEVFDFAEPTFVTGQRDATNVPTQALYLLNSAEVARMADAFARRVVGAGESEVDRVQAAFALAYGRRASTGEIRACREFLDDFKAAQARDARSSSAASAPPAASQRNRGAEPRGRAAGSRNRGAEPRGNAPAQQAGAPPEYVALCHALLLSGEFRTID